jgi:hypothetical protein
MFKEATGLGRKNEALDNWLDEPYPRLKTNTGAFD